MDSKGYRILKYLFDQGTYPDTTGINIISLLKQFYNEMYNGTDNEQTINVKIRDNILRPLADANYARFSGWKDLGIGKRGTNPDYMDTVNKSTVVNAVLLEAGYNFVIKNREEFEKGPDPIELLTLKICPFTEININAIRNNNSFEYELIYNEHTYTMRLALVDWHRQKETEEANRWIFKGLLFNNEWPIEKDTLITPQLVSHIIRLGEYPKNFNEKLDYYVLKSYLAGGVEFKSVKYHYQDYSDAYAKNTEEFLRMINGLQTRNFIEVHGQGEWFTFEEKGLTYADELNRKNNTVVSEHLNRNHSPKILIIATDKDEGRAQNLTAFLHKSGFSTSHFGYLTGDSQESTFNIEKSLENNENDYVVFIKSRNSEKNDSFKRIQIIAEREHAKLPQLNKFLFFLGVEDGPYNFPMSASHYYDTLYDYRITTNRNKFIHAIIDDWNQRVSDSFQKVASIIENLPKERNYDFPRIPLNEHDIFWLKEVYKRFGNEEEVYYQDYISKFWDILPKDYDPVNINKVLLENGSYITFYGIWRIHPETDLLKCMEKSIFSLKNILMKEGNKGQFTAEELAHEADEPIDKIIQSLRLIERFGGFIHINGTGREAGSSKSTSAKFTVTGESGLRKIKEFESLEISLKEKHPELWNNNEDTVQNPSTSNEQTPKKNLNEEVDINGEHSYRTPISIKDRELEHVMGVKELAKDITEIIDELPNDQDQMIGVFGRWGRGKTVFLSELKKSLIDSEKFKYHIIEYRAWKYQETPASWAYLYETLTNEYYKSNETALLKYIDHWGRIINLNLERNGLVPLLKFSLSFILFLLVSVGLWLGNNISALVGIPIAFATWWAFLRKTIHEYSHTANDLIKKYALKHNYKDSMGLQAEIQKEIIILLKAWSPYLSDSTREGKIVLIVEDIDRCSEEKIIQNIDSLRVMLEDPEILSRLIIITAIDDTILKNAVKIKYKKVGIKGTKKNGEFARLIAEYLDKVFLLAIKLGTLSTKNREEFIDALLKDEIDESVSTNEKADNKSRSDEGFYTPPNETSRTKMQTDFLPDESTSHSETISHDEILSDKGDYNDCKKLIPTEAKIIKDIMLNWKESTPRKMRIFYYRYLLCKTLLYKRYSSINSLHLWQSPEGVKHLLELMVTYINLNNPKEIGLDKSKIELMNEKKISLPKITSVYTIDKTDCINLLEVLEMVIAY